MKSSKILLIILIIKIPNLFCLDANENKMVINSNVNSILELQKINNIGDKPIFISIHGAGEKGGWFFQNNQPKIPDCDAIQFNWHQGKYTKGIRDKDIIKAGKELASLILDILRNIKSREIRENKQISLKLILVAHSMGGNVLKVCLNLLDHEFKKIKHSEESSGIIGTIKKTILGIFQKNQSQSEYYFIGARFDENKKAINKIKDKLTKSYYKKANNEIKNRMLLMFKAGSIPKLPFIESCYTLGTPNRETFPFTEDMNVTKNFFCLFSYGDKIQKNAGLSRIPKGENKFNIRTMIIKNGKEKDPNHHELVRGSTIIQSLNKISKENINLKLKNFIKNNKIENSEQIKTIEITFPESKDDQLKWNFNTKESPQKTIIQKTIKAIELKV